MLIALLLSLHLAPKFVNDPSFTYSPVQGVQISTFPAIELGNHLELYGWPQKTPQGFEEGIIGLKLHWDF